MEPDKMRETRGVLYIDGKPFMEIADHIDPDIFEGKETPVARLNRQKEVTNEIKNQFRRV